MAIVTTTGSLGASNLSTSGVITGGNYNADNTIGTVSYADGKLFTFNGSFAFDAGGNLTGNNLSSVTVSESGNQVTQITNINTAPPATQNFVDAGNQLGFIGFFLAGDDTITGSAGANALDGFAGNDVLIGGLGSDILDAGEGNDVIYGGEGLVSPNDGNDVITGGAGLDSLFGNAGDDVIFGGTGAFSPTDVSNEFLHGGRGNDTLFGNGGDDTLYGGEGIDVAFGGDGNDVIYGGWQQFDPTDAGDSLVGGNGNDSIFGNGGDDSLSAGNGDDVLHGGVGNDSYVFDFATTGTDTVFQFDGAGAAAGDLLVFRDTSGTITTDANTILTLVTYISGNAVIDFNILGSNLDVVINNVAANSLTVDDISFI